MAIGFEIFKVTAIVLLAVGALYLIYLIFKALRTYIVKNK